MPIRKDKIEALEARYKNLGIKSSDLREKFIHGSGRGGQKLNKTAVCVYLRHVPTGIEIKCSEDRSRSVNRFLARRRLADRIETHIKGRMSPSSQKIGKIRKQKKKRHKRAKKKLNGNG